MAKFTDVSGIDRNKLRWKALVFDFIVAAICLTAILTLLFGDFWQVKVAFTLQDEMLEQAMGEAAGGNGVTLDTSSLTDEEKTVHLSLNLTSKTMLSSVAGESEAIVTNVIDAQIASIIGQTKPLLRTVMKLVAKVSVAALVEEVKKNIAGSAEEVEQQLAEMGLELGELTQTVDTVLDELFSEKPDTEKAKAEIVGVMTKVMSQMDGADAESAQKTIDQFTEYYDALITESVNAEGELDMARVLEKVLDLVGGSGGTEQPQTAYIKLAAEPSEGAAEEGFETRVRAMIMEKLDAGTLDVIALVARICGIFLIVVIAFWAYVLLKVVLKALFAKNKTVRTFWAGFFGFLPFLVLVILPWIAMSFVLPNVLPADQLAQLAGLKLAFASTALVSFICAIALFVVWVCGGRKVRKQSKAVKRQEKMLRAQ